MRNEDDGRRTLTCFPGVAPSAMFETTTVKLRIRPFVGSHAMTAGLSERACTSILTTLSLASSGGIVTASAAPPSEGGFSSTTVVGADAGAAAGAPRGRQMNAM